MKYRYFLSALECDRFYSNFMKACDLGIEHVGIPIEISFVTDKKPTEANKNMIEKILEETIKNKKLDRYYTQVKFLRAEVVMEE